MSEILRNKTIGRLLENNANTWPDQEALVYPDCDTRYTWSAINEEVNTLARGFLALGVKKGDRVALWATNLPQWLTVLYATSKIGAVLVTVNTFYRRNEVKYLLEQSEANYLFLMDGFRGYSYVEALYSFVPELKNKEFYPLISSTLPHLKKVIFLGQDKKQGLYNYEEVLNLAPQIPLSELETLQNSQTPDEVINIQYTSGTTGFPKGVMLTHQNIVTNGYWIGHRQNFTHEDIICAPVPLFHCFGLVLAAMAALNHGATLVAMDNCSALDILQCIEKEKCTSIYGVPTMFINILEQKSFDKINLSSLRTGIMAGSPCPVKTMEEVIERMGVREITICYGLTETSPVLSQTTTTDSLVKRTQTVGKTLPGVELKIVDPETRAELEYGAIGEVAAKGYVVMSGYYNSPAETAEIIDHEGWLHTGDLGYLDKGGYLVITGRCKDIIIRAGENIYPCEVEAYLRHMPQVLDVQVVSVPSRLHGEELGAFLLARESELEITATEVKAFLRPLLSSYKIPRYVKVLAEYPLTANGKIKKYVLREMAADLWSKK